MDVKGFELDEMKKFVMPANKKISIVATKNVKGPASSLEDSGEYGDVRLAAMMDPSGKVRKEYSFEKGVVKMIGFCFFGNGGNYEDLFQSDESS